MYLCIFLQIMAGMWALLCICALALGIHGGISVEDRLAQLGRQLMLQQLFVEERIRSDGDSGIKVIRLNTVGPRPYFAEGFTSARKVKSALILLGYFLTFTVRRKGKILGISA